MQPELPWPHSLERSLPNLPLPPLYQHHHRQGVQLTVTQQGLLDLRPLRVLQVFKLEPLKPEIAFAQTYFLVETGKAALIEQRMLDAERIHARKKLTEKKKNSRKFLWALRKSIITTKTA
jgi:hypothetical protein